MKILISGVMALAASALAVSARAEDIHVGALASLTGPYAFAGVSSRDGMLVAEQEINDGKLLGSDRIVLDVEDTASDKAQGITLTNRFAADAKTLMMVGPTSSAEGLAVGPVANAQQIPDVSGTVIAPDFLKGGPWTFKTVENPDEPIRFVTQYATDHYHPKRVAIVFAHDNDAQVQQANLARKIFTDGGTEIAAEASVVVSDTDFLSQATKIAGAHVDLVFITLVPGQAANFIIQLDHAGLDSGVHILGTEAMSSEDFIKVGGAAVEGVAFYAGWFLGATTAGNAAFVADFKKRFNHSPDNYAAQGFTSVMFAADAIKATGGNRTRAALREALARPRAVPVILGIGTLTVGADRVPSYGAMMLTVRKGQFALLE